MHTIFIKKVIIVWCITKKSLNLLQILHNLNYPNGEHNNKNTRCRH